MKWENLKNNKCPMCGSLLRSCSNGTQDGYGCSTKGYECTFFVGIEKFNQIVNSLYKPKEVKDNFEALQNLGHKVVAEDFSDSPYADRA